MKAGVRGRVLRLVVVVGTALVGVAGVAYATGTLGGTSTATSVIQACRNDENGNLRVVANNATDCRKHETAISWNVVGPKGDKGDKGETGATGKGGLDGKDGAPGKDGVSVVSAMLAAGDPNCLLGGASFTTIVGDTYACNGKPGADGRNGENGGDGLAGANGLDGANGAAGQDGLSVTNTAVSSGDATCPNGGAKFVVGTGGPTYACNGTDGKDGKDGKDGASGSGLSSVNDLNGLGCSKGGLAGTISVGYSLDGSITLTCSTVSGGGGGGTVNAKGVDVTSYYFAISWFSVANAGYSFAYARIGDGASLDTLFTSNWNGIKAAGMRRGAYIDFRASEDPVQQANTLLNNVSLSPGDLIPAVFLDSTDGQADVIITPKLQAFVTRIHDVLGVYPLLRTTKAIWDNFLVNRTQLADEGVPLWISDLQASALTAIDIPANNWQGHGYAMWLRSTASVPGIDRGLVNVSQANGPLLAMP